MPRSLVLLFMVTAAVAVNAADPVSFNRDVRPILSDKCFHCHGPDAAERQAGLRLDQEDSAKQNRDGYVVIKPGDVDTSELVQRIQSDDPDLQMPPPNSGRSLSSAEKQMLVKWIKEGAVWEGHWSFIAPQRPALPSVQNRQWPRNPLDYFVLHRLEQEGLAPAQEADKTTWIRRVSFDLTGLPPTLAEVDAFLADDSDAACESVVDRLLKSPRYGEHMAAMWLDAARYADTDGYQNDGPRTMHRWRDWVIEAYNSNMPFDQFTIEQLAGDLLPNASLSQRIATGFNRNHRYNSEAGLVLEEFLLENAVDRVDTTSTVWMGLTMGCARCHDHKYDPFSQREYYQLISFFDNITESGRAVKFGNSEPWIIAPTVRQQQELKQLDAEISRVETQLAAATKEIDAQFRQVNSRLRIPNAAADNMVEASVVPRGMTHHFPFEDMTAEGISIEKGKPVLRKGLFGNAGTVGGSGVLTLGKVGDIACQTRSTISFWVKPEQLKNGVILSRQTGGTTRPGFTVELRDGHLQFYIITRWIAGVGAVETTEPLRANEWVHAALVNDGSQRAQGQQIWINGSRASTRALFNTNSNTGGTSKNAILRIGGGVQGPHFRGQVDELRFYDRSLFADEIDLLAERSTVREILDMDAGSRSERQRRKLVAWLRAPENSEQFGMPEPAALALLARFDALREQRIRLLDSFPTAMVMEERSQPRDTHLRVRGIYNSYGDVVPSDTPKVFPSIAGTGHRTRLDFARWLVSGQHPLTARVAVNRYWQQYFGTGLVPTPEDFGLQGEPPSHPELLDWLAVEFVDSGWNVKALQKQIVLSATYRQSSRMATPSGTTDRVVTSGGQESGQGATGADSGDAQTVIDSLTDPKNRLLSRGPRLRLTARQLRDQSLFVSGLMTPDIGGPSVSPYQPANLWAEMSNMKYKQSRGRDLYRRGLYTIWKRTVAPPSLAILDAADRENCTVRPKRTNTPLQALTLLNETTFVEAARHLAMRMQKEGGTEPIVFAFRTVTARYPNDVERTALKAAQAEYVKTFQDDPQQAEKLLSVGESVLPEGCDKVALAADTLLCNVILNLDEAVTKR